jgi:hypothetical protein
MCPLSWTFLLAGQDSNLQPPDPKLAPWCVWAWRWVAPRGINAWSAGRFGKVDET